jgi:DNA-binding NarL/FixJ family response regulator
MSTIKTVIIDDNLSCLNRFKKIFHNIDAVEIIAVFEDSKTGFDFVLNNQVDVLITEIEMSKFSGLEIACELNKRASKTKVIFTSTHSHYAIKAVKHSVFDYLLKPISIDELKNTLKRFNTQFKINLNTRELQIIREMSNGLSSATIGEKLFMSKHTVDTYRRVILEKAACQNTTQLIKFAFNNNLI